MLPLVGAKERLFSYFTLNAIWENLGIPWVYPLSYDIPYYFFSIIINENYIYFKGYLVESFWFFIFALTIWYFSDSLIFIEEKQRYIFFSLLLLFFTFNPWLTLDTFKSFLFNWIYTAYWLIILLYYLLLLKSNEHVTKYHLLLLATFAFLTLSTSQSLAVRAFAELLLINILFLPFILLLKNKRKIERKFILFLLFPLFIVSLYLFLYILAGYFGPLQGRVVALWGSEKPPESALQPPEAKMIYSFMGTNTWIAHSIYLPYRQIYEKGSIAGFMVLWPIIAIVGSILLIKKTNIEMLRYQFLFLLIIALLFLAWGTGINPPLTLTKRELVNAIPLIVKILPWSDSIQFVINIYFISVSYVSSYICCVLHISFNRRTWILVIRITLLIALMLLFVTAIPIYTGYVFSQYFNTSIRGFLIPNDYNYVMNLSLNFYDHILLLPYVDTYESTSWGWQGTVLWYHVLNGAILTKSIAPYSEYSQWNSIYEKISYPQLNITEGISLTKFININKISAYGSVNFVNITRLSNGSLVLDINIDLSNLTSSHVDIFLPLYRIINISNYKFIQINLMILSNNSIVLYPIFFIYSGNIGGAHLLGELKIPGSLSKTYIVGQPDKPWSMSVYNPENVTGFVLRLDNLPRNTTSILKIKIKLNVIVSNHAKLSSKYLELLNLLNIKYVIFDKSLSTYNDFWAILNMVFAKKFENVFSGKYIVIYGNITYNSSPIKIIEPSNASLKILQSSPYFIHAEIYLNSSQSNFLLIVIPMLGNFSLFSPILIFPYYNHTSLNIKRINYMGLIGYIIYLNYHTSNIVDIYIIINPIYLLLYVVLLIFSILPIILLSLALLLFLYEKTARLTRPIM